MYSKSSPGPVCSKFNLGERVEVLRSSAESGTARAGQGLLLHSLQLRWDIPNAEVEQGEQMLPASLGKQPQPQ